MQSWDIPASHSHPGGGTVKLLSVATSLGSPPPPPSPPSNLFSCLEDGNTPLQKLD